MTTSPLPILIVVVPLISAFLIPIVGWWKRNLCYYLTFAALSISVLISIAVLNTVVAHGAVHYYLGNWDPPWGIEYVVDHLNAFVVVIMSFISLVVAIYSKRSVEQELAGKIVYFYCTFLLLITGLLGMVVTGDMFNLYVFLEVASLAAYALIAIGEKGAPLASFRYVILGTIGACFYLLGVGYLYIAAGSLNMADLSQILPDLYHSKVIIVAFIFFVVGVGLKMALFPLHAWLPDAYTYAPSAVSTLIAPTMTKVGCYVLIRIMFTVFKPHFSIELIPVTTILSWIAVVAMIVGSIFAIAQTDFKRMLSYSVVAQIGYIVLGIGLANRAGLTGAVLHILNEAFTKSCLFAVAGAIVYKMGTSDMYQFRNLYKMMPVTMTAFIIGAFSMIGIPPTVGFFSKLYLILGSIHAKQWVFVAVILLSSVLNVVYFYRVIELAFLQPRELATKKEREVLQVYSQNGGNATGIRMRDGEGPATIAMDEVPLSMLVSLVVMAAGILILGIFSIELISSVIQFAIPAEF